MLKFRDDQETMIQEGSEILSRYKMLYLALEMRLGKTLISLKLCDVLRANKVLFVTVKKAIPSIKKDFKLLSPDFQLSVINYESVMKYAVTEYDVIIFDESHNLGAFPVPTNKTKNCFKTVERSKDPYVIWLSGTPSIESYAQLFHQLYMSPFHPFRKYKNFYKFHDDWGIPNTKRGSGGMLIKDYSKLKPEVIKKFLLPYSLSLTKKEAKFKQHKPTISTVDLVMPEELESIYSSILKDGLYRFSDDVVLADSAVKVMGKLSQVSSGTVIAEKSTKLLSSYKIDYINDYVLNTFNRVVIFYRYQGDKRLLETFLRCNYTSDPEKWRESGARVLILQTKSGSRGIDLSQADIQVYMTLEFSGETWTQGIDRQAHMNREKEYLVTVLCGVTSSGTSIDKEIFKRVSNKEDFNTAVFKQLRREQ